MIRLEGTLQIIQSIYYNKMLVYFSFENTIPIEDICVVPQLSMQNVVSKKWWSNQKIAWYDICKTVMHVNFYFALLFSSILESSALGKGVFQIYNSTCFVFPHVCDLELVSSYFSASFYLENKTPPTLYQCCMHLAADSQKGFKLHTLRNQLDSL